MVLLPKFERSRQTDRERHGRGARSPALLLTTSEHEWGELGITTDQKDPDTDRTMKLVGRGRQGRDPQRTEIHGDSADRLDGVGVNGHTAVPGQGGKLAQRSYRAELIVGEDASEKPSVRLDQAGHFLGIDHPFRGHDGTIHSPTQRREVIDGSSHGWVFERTTHEMRPVVLTARPSQSKEGEVVGLSPSRREDDFARVGMKDPRDGFHRVVPSTTHRAPSLMTRFGVPPSGPVRSHCLHDERVERGRGVLVQVDHVSERKKQSQEVM